MANDTWSICKHCAPIYVCITHIRPNYTLKISIMLLRSMLLISTTRLAAWYSLHERLMSSQPESHDFINCCTSEPLCLEALICFYFTFPSYNNLIQAKGKCITAIISIYQFMGDITVISVRSFRTFYDWHLKHFWWNCPQVIAPGTY